MFRKNLLTWMIFFIPIVLIGCKDKSWNNPYPASENKANTYYASFSEQPKTLDPARSYSGNETLFTAQIYEPPLQYHFLKRPYVLIPLIATEIPHPIYLDKNNQVLPDNTPSDKIAYSVYEIHIKPNIFYQPHPAFAKNKNGEYEYHHLSKKDLEDKYTLHDFSRTGTRELTADDYVYQIKRIASPHTQSPIYGFLSQYILGYSDFPKQLQNQKNKYIDLRQFPLAGALAIDKYTYRITLQGYYPQFLYWLAMPFFAPIPWEADLFYSQPGMSEKNMTFDWYPVGTGAYMLTENNPNRHMVLSRNPNFHEEFYPTDEKGNVENHRAGQRLPFIDKFQFSLEKESIPRWTKFLQGYYDQSGISSDSFDQAIHLNANGEPELTKAMKDKNIRLVRSIAPGIYYFGFNMLDPVVGGNSERARKLRQAISIVLDYEEYIAIFLNGRGIAAQGPIPPEVFGYHKNQEGINHYLYDWIENKAQRKSIEEAKKLLTEAGYQNGMDPKTNQHLLLHYDISSSGTGDDKALFSWMRKQFAKIGIQLEIRDTQYNRFQEKMRNGQAQLYSWGWSADYPDPENFLFLLYGANGKVNHGGENASNYQNDEYDALFIKMKSLPNGTERQNIINRMLEIVRHDAPWAFGFHPESFILTHSWVGEIKPNEMANNILKYIKIDPLLRAEKRKEWNVPIVWPMGILILILLAGLIPGFIFYFRQQRKPRL